MRLCCSRPSHTCLRRFNAAGNTVIGIRNLTSVSIAHRPRFALPERTRNASLPTRPGVPPSLITAISRVTSRFSSTDNVKAMSGSQLLYDDGPLVWVDCEMTGLNSETDVILEIAVIITNGRLEQVDEGIQYIIKTDKAVLDGMNEWCVDQHGRSGLTQACLDSPWTHQQVNEKVLEYIQKWIPEPGSAILAGSTVHADMRFLLRYMPEVMKHLSYRILDVSSVKEICRRWYPSVTEALKSQRGDKESAHRALDDIQASIRELKDYRERIFKPVEPIRATEEKKSEESVIRKTAL